MNEGKDGEQTARWELVRETSMEAEDQAQRRPFPFSCSSQPAKSSNTIRLTLAGKQTDELVLWKGQLHGGQELVVIRGRGEG